MHNMWNQASFFRALGREICLIYGINKNDVEANLHTFTSFGVKSKVLGVFFVCFGRLVFTILVVCQEGLKFFLLTQMCKFK